MLHAVIKGLGWQCRTLCECKAHAVMQLVSHATLMGPAHAMMEPKLHRSHRDGPTCACTPAVLLLDAPALCSVQRSAKHSCCRLGRPRSALTMRLRRWGS